MTLKESGSYTPQKGGNQLQARLCRMLSYALCETEKYRIWSSGCSYSKEKVYIIYQERGVKYKTDTLSSSEGRTPYKL